MKRRFLPYVFVAVAAFGLGCYARSDSTADALAVTDYHTALDQFGAGRAQSAQLLLETSQTRGALAPESAVLLAYLQERAGQTDRARTTLAELDNPSTLTQGFLNRLGAPLFIETAGGRSGASNPARLAASDARITRLEKEMLVLVNATRQKEGLRTLTWDENIAEVSRAHSAEMRDKKYFEHKSPNPKLRDPLDRYVAGIGTTPRLVGENVYRAWGSTSSLNSKAIAAAHDALMKSPGHRSNILLEGATRIGIGIVSNSNGDIWITQMFARPQ